MVRQVRDTPNRFGEPEPNFDIQYADPIRGIFSKLGSSPEGVIAASGDIVLVDTRAFKGKTNFPADLTALWREAGDLACLIQPWKEGDTSVVVKRQLPSDARNLFSHPTERFMVTTTCMPERHVLCAMSNNVYLGYYQTNPEFASPEMKAWNSVRRGIPLENPQCASPYMVFVSEMAGPVGVLDVLTSTLTAMHDHLSMTQVSAAQRLPPDQQSFESLIVSGKPDKDIAQVVWTFVTNWRVVFALREISLDAYKSALRVALIHRKSFDLEKACHQCNWTVSDIESVSLLMDARLMARDAVRKK